MNRFVFNLTWDSSADYYWWFFFCLLILPLANIVSAFGPTGANSKDPGTITFWGMTAGFCVFVTAGVKWVFAGYMAMVHDRSHRYFNITLMIAIQTAWIGYITDMTAVGRGSQLPVEMNGSILLWPTILKILTSTLWVPWVFLASCAMGFCRTNGIYGLVSLLMLTQLASQRATVEITLRGAWTVTRVP